MMKAYGRKVVLTPAKEEMEGCVLRADAIAKRKGHGGLTVHEPGQQRGPHAHDGKEIISQTRGKVDAFVAGVGTGGTLMGVAGHSRRKV